MKRILAIILLLFMLASLTACQSTDSNADIKAMKIQLQLMQQQLNKVRGLRTLRSHSSAGIVN